MIIYDGNELSIYLLAEAAFHRCSPKVALQVYGNHTSGWVFSCKFTVYFQNTFSLEHLWRAASVLGSYNDF